MRDRGKILALAHTVQAGASLCLVQKLPVPLVSLSACKAGRPRTVEGAMCPSRWHASVCPGLIAVFPCVFWLPLLFTGRFQHIAASAGDERSDPAPVQLTWPVCAISELVFGSRCPGVHASIGPCSPRGGELQHALSPCALPPRSPSPISVPKYLFGGFSSILLG